MKQVALTLLAILLTACNSAPVIPKIGKVPVIQYVPLPASLTKDCDLVPKRENSVGEAVRLANARLESLKKCNADKAAIRKLTP